MCKGKCKECRHLSFPSATRGNTTVFCSECTRYGIRATFPSELHQNVLEELEMARDTFKRHGKAEAVWLHGKEIAKEAERQEAKIA